MRHRRIGSGGTKVKGTSGAGIFFTDGTKALLLKRSDESDHAGTWALPGGGAKSGETIIGTAMRETKEETGLESIPGYRIESFDSKNGRQKFTVFIYRVPAPFDITISKEHTDWEWVSLDELTSKHLHPKFEEHLPRYLRGIRRKTTNFNEWAEITRIILG